MRPEFLAPKGALTAEVVRDTLSLAMSEPPTLEIVARWTRFELMIVYDWAMREHLRASDNLTVPRRERPYLVTLVLDARQAGAFEP